MVNSRTKIHVEDIWTQGGTVEAVMLRSATQVWTQGGGSYVGPNGGFVSPPELRAATTEFKEGALPCRQ
jgi:hypothetical protein